MLKRNIAPNKAVHNISNEITNTPIRKEEIRTMAPCVSGGLDDASRGMPSHVIWPYKLVLLSHVRQGSLSSLCRPWKLAVRGGHKIASHPKNATCPMFQPSLLESHSVDGRPVIRLLRRKMTSLSNLHMWTKRATW